MLLLAKVSCLSLTCCREQSTAAHLLVPINHAVQDKSKLTVWGLSLQVLGGTGRVGGSTAEALLNGPNADQYKVQVAGRSEDNYHKASKRRPSLSGAEFLLCDIDNLQSAKVSLTRHVESHFCI